MKSVPMIPGTLYQARLTRNVHQDNPKFQVRILPCSPLDSKRFAYRKSLLNLVEGHRPRLESFQFLLKLAYPDPSWCSCMRTGWADVEEDEVEDEDEHEHEDAVWVREATFIGSILITFLCGFIAAAVSLEWRLHGIPNDVLTKDAQR